MISKIEADGNVNLVSNLILERQKSEFEPIEFSSDFTRFARMRLSLLKGGQEKRDQGHAEVAGFQIPFGDLDSLTEVIPNIVSTGELSDFLAKSTRNEEGQLLIGRRFVPFISILNEYVIAHLEAEKKIPNKELTQRQVDVQAFFQALADDLMETGKSLMLPQLDVESGNEDSLREAIHERLVYPYMHIISHILDGSYTEDSGLMDVIDGMRERDTVIGWISRSLGKLRFFMDSSKYRKTAINMDERRSNVHSSALKRFLNKGWMPNLSGIGTTQTAKTMDKMQRDQEYLDLHKPRLL